MSGVDVGAVREALAAVLSEPTLADELNVYARPVGNECMPALIVSPLLGPREIAKCRSEMQFVLGLYIAIGEADAAESASEYLDALLSTRGDASITRRLHANRTLGGVVIRTQVDPFRAYGLGRLNSSDKNNCLSAQVPVTVRFET